MKHQVLFFLSFISCCSIYSMDINKPTNDQIANFLIQYGKTVRYYFPYSEYANNFATIEKDAEVIRQNLSSDEDKKVMIKVIRSLPYFVKRGDKICLTESSCNESESTE